LIGNASLRRLASTKRCRLALPINSPVARNSMPSRSPLPSAYAACVAAMLSRDWSSDVHGPLLQ